MADRIELLVTEDSDDSPWWCGIEDCPKVPSHQFCLGPCLVNNQTGVSLRQEVRRDIIALDTFAGQPGLMSFDVYLVGPPGLERALTVTSTVDFGRQPLSRPFPVLRTNSSQHCHHDLVVPTGYNAHGNSITLLIEGTNGSVDVPYNIYIDNLSLTLFYPPGETGSMPEGTTLGGHAWNEYTSLFSEASTLRNPNSAPSPSATHDSAATSDASNRPKINLGAIIGGSLTGIFLIGVVWILLVGYMNRRKLRYQAQRTTPFSGSTVYPGSGTEQKYVGTYPSPPTTSYSGHRQNTTEITTLSPTTPGTPMQVPSWVPTAFPLPPHHQQSASQTQVPLLRNPNSQQQQYPQFRDTGLPSYESHPHSPHPISPNPISPHSEFPTETDMGTALSSSVDHGRPRTAPDRKYTVEGGRASTIMGDGMR